MDALSLLRDIGVRVSPTFLNAHGIQDGNTSGAQVLEAVLRSDIRDVIHGMESSLPAWVEATVNVHTTNTDDNNSPKIVAGKHLLQIDDLLNVSANARARYEPQQSGFRRCLKLSITDGRTRCIGFEMLPIADLEVQTLIGTKIVVSECEFRHGMLCLSPENLVVLGGGVDSLDVARRRVVETWMAPARGGKNNTEGLTKIAKDIFIQMIGIENQNNDGNINTNANNHNVATGTREVDIRPQNQQMDIDRQQVQIRDQSIRDGNLGEHAAYNTPTSMAHNRDNGAMHNSVVGLHPDGMMDQTRSDIPLNVEGHSLSIEGHHAVNTNINRDISRRGFDGNMPNNTTAREPYTLRPKLVFNLDDLDFLTPGIYAVKASIFDLKFNFRDRATRIVLDNFEAHASLEDGRSTRLANLSLGLIQSLVGEGISPGRFGSILEGSEGEDKKASFTEHMKGPNGVLKTLQRFDGIVEFRIISTSINGDEPDGCNNDDATIASGGATLEITALRSTISKDIAWQLYRKALQTLSAT